MITSIEKYGYMGESGLIQVREKQRRSASKSAAKVHLEECFCVCMTRVDVLILNESDYNLIDDETFDFMFSSFKQKNRWRRERARQLLKDEERMSKYKRDNHQQKKPLITDFSNELIQDSSNDSVDEEDPQMQGRNNSKTSSKIGKLIKNINDIPAILDQSFNPLMIMPTCKTPRDKEKMLEFLDNLHRSKGAKMRAKEQKNQDKRKSHSRSPSRSPSPTAQEQVYSGPAASSSHGLTGSESRLQPSQSAPVVRFEARSMSASHAIRRERGAIDNGPGGAEAGENSLDRPARVAAAGGVAGRVTFRGDATSAAVGVDGAKAGGGSQVLTSMDGSLFSPVHTQPALERNMDMSQRFQEDRNWSDRRGQNSSRLLRGYARIPSAMSFHDYSQRGVLASKLQYSSLWSDAQLPRSREPTIRNA